MNKKIYSLVWNKSLKQVVVASELATANGGGASAGCASGDRQSTWRRSGLVAALVVALGLLPLVALSATQAQVSDQHAGAVSSLAANHAVARSVMAAASQRNSVQADEDDQHAAPSDDALVFGSTAIGYTAFADATTTGTPRVSPLIANPGSYAHYFDANGPMDGSDDANAAGAYSVAAGSNSIASGQAASAFGESSEALGDYSVALGSNAYAGSQDGIAIGNNSYVAQTAIGGYAAHYAAVPTQGIAIGANASVTGLEGTALGANATASNLYTTALGTGSTASGENSTAVGVNAQATNRSDNALGFGAQATGEFANAFGTSAYASGWRSTAVGQQATATATMSTAMGASAFAAEAF